MAEESKIEEKKIPRGGRKGGVQFPRLNLAKAIGYAKKLVSKTHTGPQPAKNILPGVFDTAGPRGSIRASALKQYDLLEGPTDAYKATELAKSIDAAPEGERPVLMKRAFLKPKVFNDLYQTFHGDTVSRAKLEQRAKALEVHPDTAEECVQLFVDSAVTAGLGTLDGDSLALVASAVPMLKSTKDEEAEHDEEDDEHAPSDDDSDEEAGVEEAPSSLGTVGGAKSRQKSATKLGTTLNLQVDPSSDPDKLEKQLKLLRKYGLI